MWFLIRQWQVFTQNALFDIKYDCSQLLDCSRQRGLLSVMFRLLLWCCQNERKAQSNCIHDPTFRHSCLVSSLGVNWSRNLASKDATKDASKEAKWQIIYSRSVGRVYVNAIRLGFTFIINPEYSKRNMTAPYLTFLVGTLTTRKNLAITFFPKKIYCVCLKISQICNIFVCGQFKHW